MRAALTGFVFGLVWLAGCPVEVRQMSGGNHPIGPNTVFCLRLDENATDESARYGDNAIRDDGPYGRDLTVRTAPDPAFIPWFVPGPQGQILGAHGTQPSQARMWEYGMGAHHSPAALNADRDKLQGGNFTMAVWLRQPIVTGDGDNGLIKFGVPLASTTGAENVQFAVDIRRVSGGEGDGNGIYVAWDTSNTPGSPAPTGANSAAHAFSLETWHHLVVTVAKVGDDPGTRTVKAWVDKVEVISTAGLAPPVGGDDCFWVLARGYYFDFVGALRSMVFFGHAVNQAQVNALYDASVAHEYTHQDTGDTIVHWQCDEAPSALDAVGNMHLTYYPPQESARGLVADGGRARVFRLEDPPAGGLSTQVGFTYDNEVIQDALEDEFTLGMTIVTASDFADSDYRSLLSFGHGVMPPEEPGSSFFVLLKSDGALFFYYLDVANEYTVIETPPGVVPTSYDPTTLVLGKRMSGEYVIWILYVAGESAWESTAQFNINMHDDTSGNPAYFALSSFFSEEENGPFHGVMDDVWLERGPPDAAVIAAEHEASLCDCGAGHDEPAPLPAPLPPALTLATLAALGETGALGDIRLTWADGTIDASIENDDIAADPGLHTAVLLSLFTDRRAFDDDPLPSNDGDRRGWWGDAFAAVPGDLYGSRLWLLDRSKRLADVVPRAKEFVTEALAWFIEDRVAEKIDIEVTTEGQTIFEKIDIWKPGAKTPITFRFAHVWSSP